MLTVWLRRKFLKRLFLLIDRVRKASYNKIKFAWRLVHCRECEWETRKGVRMKRVLTMQDMSCFGRCSLTVAIPIISAMGVECVPLPSTILSTHTGGLGEAVITDLSEAILPTVEHFERLGIVFDVIYIGYLGSKRQIELAKQVIERLKTKETLVLIDPVMGDHGCLYRRFDMAYVGEMARLVEHADYLLPNLTEAALLAGLPFAGDLPTAAKLKELSAVIEERYAARCIITGVGDGEKTIGAASLRKDAGTDVFYVTKRHCVQFHGTGDIFASVMTGALAKGKTLQKAVEQSVDFTAAVIERTITAATDERYGVWFEDCLPMLFTGTTESADP